MSDPTNLSATERRQHRIDRATGPSVDGRIPFPIVVGLSHNSHQ
jgi:hypothetical protein